MHTSILRTDLVIIRNMTRNVSGENSLERRR